MNGEYIEIWAIAYVGGPSVFRVENDGVVRFIEGSLY